MNVSMIKRNRCQFYEFYGCQFYFRRQKTELTPGFPDQEALGALRVEACR